MSLHILYNVLEVKSHSTKTLQASQYKIINILQDFDAIPELTAGVCAEKYVLWHIFAS